MADVIDVTADATDVTDVPADSNAPVFDSSGTVTDTVTVSAPAGGALNKPNYLPLILIALAVGALWYFGSEHEEA